MTNLTVVTSAMSGVRAVLLNPWVYWGLTIAYFATIISIIGVVLSENRNPLKSLAWITVLLLFPIGGLVLYIFFGRSIKNQRMISRRNRRKLMQRGGPHVAPGSERNGS